jgi:hypothetical protein
VCSLDVPRWGRQASAVGVGAGHRGGRRRSSWWSSQVAVVVGDWARWPWWWARGAGRPGVEASKEGAGMAG